MISLTPHRFPEYLSRVMPAALFAVAAAFGTTTLGDSAVASAEPEWDVGAWDQCVNSFDGNPNTLPSEMQRWLDHLKYCCEKTGGVFNDVASTCRAPPAKAVESQPGSPWRPPADSIGTLPLAPNPDNPAGPPQQGVVG